MKRATKQSIKKIIRTFAKILPRSIKVFVRNVFAELAGTREVRDLFRQIYGDYAVYEKFLKDKSDVTEYHVDKIFRSVGQQMIDLQSENKKLAQRISVLESKKSK